MSPRFFLVVFLGLVLSAVGPLRSTRAAEPQPATTAKAPLTNGQRIRAALDSTITESIDGQELGVLVTHIGETHKIPVFLDLYALEQLAVEPTVQLNCNLRDVKLRTALDFALRPMNLKWAVRDDVLIITSQTEADSLLETRTYEVTDLVDRTPSYDTNPLIDVITSTTAPATWREVGGNGVIEEFILENAVALVVSHTYRVHEEVEALLTNLRTLRNNPATDKRPATPIKREQPKFNGGSTAG